MNKFPKLQPFISPDLIHIVNIYLPFFHKSEEHLTAITRNLNMGAEKTVTAEAVTLRGELLQSFIQAGKSPLANAPSKMCELMSTSAKILDVLCSYRMGSGEKTGSRADEGCLKFLAIIYGHVKVR